LATKALAAAFKHGGDEVGLVLKFVDKDAAELVKNNMRAIGDELEDIAKIPDLTSNIIKDKLYHFLVRELAVPPKAALQIADGVKRAINILVL
jgi:hypothetical protein